MSLADLRTRSMEFRERTSPYFEWSGPDVRLVGGFETAGWRPEGLRRLRFLCVGVPELFGADREDAALGHVELFVDEGVPPSIRGLVAIEVRADRRRRGIGTRIVDAVAEACQDRLAVYSITERALGFWRALGVEPDPENWMPGRRHAFLPDRSPSPAFV